MDKYFISNVSSVNFLIFLCCTIILYGCNKKDSPTQIAQAKFQTNIEFPLSDELVFSNVLLKANATDPKGIASLNFVVDGEIDSILTIPPFNYIRNFANSKDKRMHSLYTKAINTEGNHVSSNLIYFTMVKNHQPSDVSVMNYDTNKIIIKWTDNSDIENKFYVLNGTTKNDLSILDSVSSDIYSIQISKDKFNSSIMNYFAIIAANNNSYSTLSNIDSINIKYPPIISNLEAPDSLILSVNSDLQINLKVTDFNGLNDLSNVYFELYAPKSASPNKLRMYLSEKYSEVSGIYSFKTSFSDNSTTGLYKFYFQAIDNEGYVSNLIKHDIIFIK